MSNAAQRLLISTLSKAFNFLRLFSRPLHRKNVAKSRRVAKKLATLNSEPQVIAYLRKIDPSVFEELALTLFEAHGYVVLRNLRYSGDGGVDGRVFIPGCGWTLIQCKRYGSAINPEHVRQFESQLLSQKRYGLFIHTGRTGPLSRTANNKGVILSGFWFARMFLLGNFKQEEQKLLRILRGR